MGLEAHAALRAADVASQFGVTVWPHDRISSIPLLDRNYLVGFGRNEWLGITLHLGDRHLIVTNTAQPSSQQNSLVMHELAHIMLGHELASSPSVKGVPVPVALGIYSQEQEDEAAWLGSTLLLPRPALVWIRQERMSDDDAATHFGMSVELLKWRIRTAGIDYQLRLDAPQSAEQEGDRLANTRFRRRRFKKNSGSTVLVRDAPRPLRRPEGARGSRGAAAPRRES
jgi:uncharacterized protein DUF955